MKERDVFKSRNFVGWDVEVECARTQTMVHSLLTWKSRGRETLVDCVERESQHRISPQHPSPTLYNYITRETVNGL